MNNFWIEQAKSGEMPALEKVYKKTERLPCKQSNQQSFLTNLDQQWRTNRQQFLMEDAMVSYRHSRPTIQERSYWSVLADRMTAEINIEIDREIIEDLRRNYQL